MLLRCTDSAQHMSQLIRRVQARGRENSSFAESRVRKNFPDTARSWAIVAALPPRLRGITVDVDAMQVGDLQSWCSPTLLFWWLGVGRYRESARRLRTDAISLQAALQREQAALAVRKSA